MNTIATVNTPNGHSAFGLHAYQRHIIAALLSETALRFHVADSNRHGMSLRVSVEPRAILGHEPTIILIDEAPLCLDRLQSEPIVPDLTELAAFEKEQALPEFEPNPFGRVGRAHGGKHRGRRNGGAFGRCRRY